MHYKIQSNTTYIESTVNICCVRLFLIIHNLSNQQHRMASVKTGFISLIHIVMLDTIMYSVLMVITQNGMDLIKIIAS
jgi:hypothetical protein